MSKSDFQKRLARIDKVPSSGTRRAVDKAMLQQEIAEVRHRNERDRAEDEDDPRGWTSYVWVLIFLSALYLAGLFVTDPAEATRVSIVIVPLMLFLIAVIFFRDTRRHGMRSVLWNALDFSDIISRIFHLLR